MNTKQLFLAISMIAMADAAKAADQNKRSYSEQDVRKILRQSFFTYYDIHQNPFFKSCGTNASSHCILVMEHLEKAIKHDEERLKIQKLEQQLKELSSEQLQKPVKKRLDEAQNKHPHGQKSYWVILSEQEQNALIDAAAEIAEKNNYTMSHVINELQKALNH